MPLPIRQLPSQAAPAPNDAAMRSLLRQIGSGVQSGANVVANTLNKPSRALWGSLNYLAGGDSGGGLLNLVPFSDTMGLTDPNDGIQASDFLANQGLISKNDPNKWELMDPIRGVIDIAGDPLTYLSPLSLTAKGAGLAKTGSLSKGLLGQIRQGERGLVGYGVPFMDRTAHGVLGTGSKTADALQSAGTAVMNTPYVGKALQGVNAGLIEPGRRLGRALFDQKVQGALSGPGQDAFENLTRTQSKRMTDLESRLTLSAQKLAKAGLNTPEDGEVLRHFLETGQWSRTPNPVELEIAPDLMKLRDEMLQTSSDAALVTRQLADPAGISYFPRQYSSPTGGANGNRSSRIAGTGDRGNVPRQLVFQGFKRGTQGINDLFRDPDIIAAATASGVKKADRIQQVSDLVRAKFGGEIEEFIGKVTKGGQPVLDPVTGQQVMLSRYDELGKQVVGRQSRLGKGLFTNHPLVDALQRFGTRTGRATNADMLADVAAKHAGSGSGPSIKEIFTKANEGKTGLDRTAFLDKIATLRGQKPLTQQFANNPRKLAKAQRRLESLRLDESLGRDVLRRFEKISGPESVQRAVKMFDQYNSLWKAGVLSFPARISRDFVSGLGRLWDQGWLNRKSVKESDLLFRGQAVQGLETVPAIRDMLTKQGLPVTPENAADAYKSLYGARYGKDFMWDRQGLPKSEDLSAILGNVPGQEAVTPGQFLKSAGQKAVGINPATGSFEKSRFNPLSVRGVGGRDESLFGPVAASEQLGSYTDGLTRMAADLELLKRGYSPEQATELVNAAFVDYSNKALTPFEQAVRRVVPFYSFTKGQVKHLAGELASNPGGRQAQMIRGVSEMQGNDPTVPEYVRQTSGIPLGQDPDGTQRYLTGLGLMQEGPLAFLGGGAQGALMEGLSSVNPLIKAPIEYATGESFFQRGPLGGRDLGDLDPTIGRLLSNIGESTGLRDPGSGPVRYPGQFPLEFIAGNSPLARGLSTARVLSDPRKSLGERAMNALTGFRSTTISPGAQDAVLRDAAAALGKQLGAKEFSRIRFTEDELQRLEATNPTAAETARAFNELQKQLANRQKSRRK